MDMDAYLKPIAEHYAKLTNKREGDMIDLAIAEQRITDLEAALLIAERDLLIADVGLEHVVLYTLEAATKGIACCVAKEARAKISETVKSIKENK